MTHWLYQLKALKAGLDADDRGVMVTIANVRGSSPREAGAKMMLSKHGCLGSIGGGQLEHQCQQLALEFIRRQNLTKPERRNFPLGANCGQCCGGTVDVLFEPVDAPTPAWLDRALAAVEQDHMLYLHTDFSDGAKRVLNPADAKALSGSEAWHALATDIAVSTKSALIERICPSPTRIALFGAGHVGQALVKILSTLDCRVYWVDSRPGLFGVDADNGADNIVPVQTSDPAAYAAGLSSGTLCLVMTHSHPLDFDVCAKLLIRDDIPFCGLIGSASKRARFERLFKQAGLTPAQIARLTCPIGIDGIGGKAPAEIAVAAAAQVLKEAHRATDTLSKNKDVAGAAVST